VTPLEVPWDALSAEALQGIVEEFVTREGTEYGAIDVSLATKVKQVRSQIEQGEVLIFFDQATSSCQLKRRAHVTRRATDQ
jgi:uncharacterized protein YheU (UPF0270 family)